MSIYSDIFVSRPRESTILDEIAVVPWLLRLGETRSGCAGAAVLLALCPGLEALTLDLTGGILPLDLALLCFWLSQWRAFVNLKVVRVVATPQCSLNIFPQNLANDLFLLAPYTDELVLCHIRNFAGDLPYMWPSSRGLAQMRRLTRLSFENCPGSTDIKRDLCKMTILAPDIEQFNFSSKLNMAPNGSNARSDIEEVLEALRPLRRTLRCLSLDFSQSRRKLTLLPYELLGLWNETLRSLTHLEVLEMDYSCFCRHYHHYDINHTTNPTCLIDMEIQNIRSLTIKLPPLPFAFWSDVAKLTWEAIMGGLPKLQLVRLVLLPMPYELRREVQLKMSETCMPDFMRRARYEYSHFWEKIAEDLTAAPFEWSVWVSSTRLQPVTANDFAPHDPELVGLEPSLQLKAGDNWGLWL